MERVLTLTALCHYFPFNCSSLIMQVLSKQILLSVILFTTGFSCNSRLEANSLKNRFFDLRLLSTDATTRFSHLSVKLQQRQQQKHPTHPDSHEAVSEYNPREQEDEGLVTTEERRHVCCVDLPEGLQVQVVGEDPQQAKGRHLGEEHLGGQPVIPEEPTALPAHIHTQCRAVFTY